MRSDAFHAPRGVYLLSHSIGLQPVTAAAALSESYIEPWRRGDAAIWDGWLVAIERFRSLLAPLIGAFADDICPQANVSSALTKVLFSLPDRRGRRKIVLTEDDFPTIGFVAEKARRAGYEIELLRGGLSLSDPDAWSRAFAEDVQLVIATHVFSNSSVRAPVEEIARHARNAGVFSLLDLAQSAGAIPIALREWEADFAIGTSVKYLCGGPGASFLWVAPETAVMCAPADVGWFSHENPFEFNIRSFRYAPGAARFWGGTPSVAPYAVASAGLAAIAKHGVARIEQETQGLMDRLFEATPSSAWKSSTARGRRGASAIWAPPQVDASASALRNAGFLFDRREGGVRLSLHLYNDAADVEAFVAAVSPFI